MSEHAHQVVHFHAELRRLRGNPDAVEHRSGVLTGYCLESLLEASRGAGRVDLALDAEPEPATLAWLQDRLTRARARGIRVIIDGSRGKPRAARAARDRSLGHHGTVPRRRQVVR